MKETEVGT